MPRVAFDQLSDDARLLIFRSRDTSPRRPMSERKQINFTVIPDESDDVPLFPPSMKSSNASSQSASTRRA